jgi:hypothetical protein
MIITELNIPCIWHGTLTGILLKNDSAPNDRLSRPTVKIVGIHGWLDNLNSLLPVAKKLIERHPSKTALIVAKKQHLFFVLE